MPLSRFAVAGRQVLHGVADDALLTRAAAIAFYSALSFAPLMVLLLWLLAALRPEWQQQLTAGLARILGEKAAGAIGLVVDNAKSTPTLGNTPAWPAWPSPCSAPRPCSPSCSGRST